MTRIKPSQSTTTRVTRAANRVCRPRRRKPSSINSSLSLRLNARDKIRDYPRSPSTKILLTFSLQSICHWICYLRTCEDIVCCKRKEYKVADLFLTKPITADFDGVEGQSLDTFQPCRSSFDIGRAFCWRGILTRLVIPTHHSADDLTCVVPHCGQAWRPQPPDAPFRVFYFAIPSSTPEKYLSMFVDNARRISIRTLTSQPFKEMLSRKGMYTWCGDCISSLFDLSNRVLEATSGEKMYRIIAVTTNF